jgi:hypothetical protein
MFTLEVRFRPKAGIGRRVSRCVSGARTCLADIPLGGGACLGEDRSLIAHLTALASRRSNQNRT